MANGRGYRPHVCKVCGKIDDDAGPISFRHKCQECAERLQVEAIQQMNEGAGPVFEKWRAQMIGALWPRLDVNPATGERRRRRAS